MSAIEQLYKRAIAGDQQSEHLLFDYLRVRFALLAKQRIGKSDAEDIAQDSCLTVLKKYKADSEIDNFEAWAYQILRNKIGNYLKNRAVQQKIDQKGWFVDLREKYSGSFLSLEMLSKLTDCMRKLMKVNRRYARILNLSHQGYMAEEICEKLNITKANCYVILNRSRAILKGCLNEGEEDNE